MANQKPVSPSNRQEKAYRMRRIAHLFLGITFVTLLASCSSLTIENVQYDWPVESVLTVTGDNMVADGHHALTFSAAGIASEEFQDSTALRGKQIRLLRSFEGFYFLTGPQFKNVYVFTAKPGKLTLKSKIEVAPNGLNNPAMNQRPPYVELLDGTTFTRKLTSDEVVKEERP
jgi:hypothetical protein